MFLSSAQDDAALLASLDDDATGSKGSSTTPRLGLRSQTFAIVVAGADLALAEKAILETGLANRGAALTEIFRAYLNAKGQFNIPE